MHNGNAKILVEQEKHLRRDDIDTTRQMQRLQRQQFRLIREATIDVYGSLDLLSQSSYRNWDVIDEDVSIGAVIPPIGKYKLKRGEEIPVYENEYQLWTYQARSRVLCYFNEFAICGIENRVDYIIGEGLSIKAKPIDAQNSRHRRLAERCQEFIDLVADVNDLSEMEAETSARCDEDGETFIRIFPDENGIPYFSFSEPEHVRSRTGSSWSPKYSFGIETPENNVTIPLNYWMVENPNYSWESCPIPAKEVVHIKYNVKRNSKRGLPTYFPIESNFRRCEDLLHSMTAMAKTRAKIALLVKLTGVTQSAAQALQDKLTKIRVNDSQLNSTLDLEKFPYGSVIKYPGVQEYTMPSHSIGASDFVEVLQAELRGIASRLRMPEWMFTALPDAKYSNAFVVEAPTLKGFKKKQKLLCNFFGNYKYGYKRSLMWRAVIIGIEHGILDPDTPNCINIECTGPSLETRDKQQEATTNKTYNDMRIKSKKTIRNEISLDSETEENNFLEEDVKDDIEQAKSAFTQVVQIQTAVYGNQMPREAGLGLLKFIGIDDEQADQLLPEQQQTSIPGSPSGNPPVNQPGITGNDTGIPQDTGTDNPPSGEEFTDTGESGNEFDLDSAVSEFWNDAGIGEEQLSEQYSTQIFRLIEKGFTGTITDKLGRKIKYEDGKRVTGQQIPIAKKIPVAKKIPIANKLKTASKLVKGVPILSPVTKKKVQKARKIAPTKAKKILTQLGKLYKEVNPKHAKQVKKAYKNAVNKYGPTLAKFVIATAIAGVNTTKLAQFAKDTTDAIFAAASFFSDLTGRAKKAIKAFTEQYDFLIIEQYTKKMHFELVEAGFTGTVRDSRGRVFYYENGKRIKNPHATKSTSRMGSLYQGIKGIDPRHHKKEVIPEIRANLENAIGSAITGNLSTEHMKSLAEGLPTMPVHELKKLAALFKQKIKGKLKDEIVASVKNMFPLPELQSPTSSISVNQPKSISEILDKRTSNPVNVKLTIEGDESILPELFGSKPDIQTFMRVGNVLTGDETKFSLRRPEHKQPYATISSYGKFSEAIRVIYKDDNGDLVLSNASYTYDKDKASDEYKGLTGADIFARQVEAARALGIKRIETYAAGNKHTANINGSLKTNGYYTWPRLGYDGDIPPTKFMRLPEELKQKMGDKRNMLSLYAIPGGKEWWKENGGSLRLSFNLDENSESYKTLLNYMQERKNKQNG